MPFLVIMGRTFPDSDTNTFRSLPFNHSHPKATAVFCGTKITHLDLKRRLKQNKICYFIIIHNTNSPHFIIFQHFINLYPFLKNTPSPIRYPKRNTDVIKESTDRWQEKEKQRNPQKFSGTTQYPFDKPIWEITNSASKFFQ